MGAAARFRHCQEDTAECAGCVENAVRFTATHTLAVFVFGFDAIFVSQWARHGVRAAPAGARERVEAAVAEEVARRFGVRRAQRAP